MTRIKQMAPGLTSEEMKALFFDTTALREPAYRIYQLNGGGYRYYYSFDQEGKPRFYPSVTTLLRKVMPTPPTLIEWMLANGKDGAEEKRDLAAAYGTFMHIQFERLIIDRRYDFDKVPETLREYMEANNLPEKFFGDSVTKIRKDVLSFAQFIKDYNIRPLAIEIGLAHPEKGFAGCIDMPCVMSEPKTGEDFRAIVDFKSGRKGFYEEHELQLLLYRDMWNYNFPDAPITRVFNFSPKDWRKAPTYNLKEQTNSESAAKIPYLLELAAIDADQQDKTVTIINGSIDLDKGGETSENIMVVTLSDLVKERRDGKRKPKTAAKGENKPVERKTPTKARKLHQERKKSLKTAE